MKVTLEALVLIIVFISAHACFMLAMLYYVRKRFVQVYGRIFDIEARLNYHAVAMAENELIPIPWELDELEEIQEKIKVDKEENVVYINYKDKK